MNYDEVFKDFPYLETDRLILRALDIDNDKETLFNNIYSDNEVTKYDGNKVYDVGEDGGFLSPFPTMSSKMHLWQQGFWNRRLIVWGIELKENNELIGIRLCEFYPMGIVTLESKLNRLYWRKGLMTEASKAIINFLELHDVAQIITTVNENNSAAIALDNKLGFSECTINDIYISENLNMSQSMAVQGLVQLMQEPNELIYVKPKINPMAFQAFEYAELAKQEGNYPSASLLLKQALKAQPNFIHALNGLAWMELEMGNTNQAISDFNRILLMKPNKYSALLGRAYAYADLQKWDEGSKDLISYLELLPNDDETYVMLGSYYYQMKKYKDAFSTYETALQINPTNQEARQYKQALASYL